jgi:hypothetical protein
MPRPATTGPIPSNESSEESRQASRSSRGPALTSTSTPGHSLRAVRSRCSSTKESPNSTTQIKRRRKCRTEAPWPLPPLQYGLLVQLTSKVPNSTPRRSNKTGTHGRSAVDFAPCHRSCCGGPPVRLTESHARGRSVADSHRPGNRPRTNLIALAHAAIGFLRQRSAQNGTVDINCTRTPYDRASVPWLWSPQRS